MDTPQGTALGTATIDKASAANILTDTELLKLGLSVLAEQEEGRKQAQLLNEDALLEGPAFKTFRAGIDAADPFKTSEHAIAVTPPHFKRNDPKFELRDHEKDAIGKANHRFHSEDGGPTSAVVAHETDSGIKNIVIALINLNKDNSADPQLLIISPNAEDRFLWKRELGAKLDPALKVLFYNQDDNISATDLRKHDLIVTTHHCLRAEFDSFLISLGTKTRASTTNSQPSHKIPLFEVHFSYTYVDEIECITGSEDHALKAACALKSDHKCGVIATALDGDHPQVLALFKFLQVIPWSNDEMFNKHFVRQSEDEEANQKKTAILHLSTRSCIFNLIASDNFNGKPVKQPESPDGFTVTVTEMTWQELELVLSEFADTSQDHA